MADVARNPTFPESGARAAEGGQAPRPVHREEHAAADRAREVPVRALSRPRLRPRCSRAEAALQGYTLAQVQDFYARNFGAARAHLYVVGRFDARGDGEGDPRRVLRLGRPGPAPVLTPPQPQSVRGVHLVDRPGAVQSTLIVGMPVIDPSQPDYVPLVVTNTLLGGYFSSRMTANLREQKGYTYSPFSQLSSRQRDAYWAQNADVTTAVTGPSLKEIFCEIDRLQAEPPTADELQAVKNYAAGTFVLQNSSRGGIINQLRVRRPARPAGDVPRRLRRARERGHARRRSSRWRRSTSPTTRRPSSWWATGRSIEEQVKPYGPLLSGSHSWTTAPGSAPARSAKKNRSVTLRGLITPYYGRRRIPSGRSRVPAERPRVALSPTTERPMHEHISSPVRDGAPGWPWPWRWVRRWGRPSGSEPTRRPASPGTGSRSSGSTPSGTRSSGRTRCACTR